jgi:dienelactone hydrolase
MQEIVTPAASTVIDRRPVKPDTAGMLAPRFWILAMVAVCGLAGEDLPKGRVLERVVCAGNPNQGYALYLPPDYSAEHAWPILYCLDPLARGRVPVERFHDAAARAGFIVAGSNNSRNGPNDLARDAIQWLLSDTHERFAIDDSRVYVAGFSGGARLALAWASSARIAGVIACGAGFGGSQIPKQVPLRIYATAGVDDFNYDEVYAMSRELSRRGVPQRFAPFAGGHDWLPEALTAEALDFLSGRLAAEPPPPESSEQRKTAALYSKWTGEVERGDERDRVSTIHRVRRDSERPEDGPERRAARRVLTGVFIGAIEQGRALLHARQYQEAGQALELAVLVRPENAEAWYALAESRAGSHEKRRALDALQLAIEKGFSDRDRIEHDPLFDGLRKESKYAAAISAISR